MNTYQGKQQKVDRFLLGIVGGVVVLVVVALVLVWQTPTVAEYQPEDTPAGIAFNYLIALQREEYERAYTYLAPDLPNYPTTAAAFFVEVQDWWCFNNQERSSPLDVGDVNIVGERAIVQIVQRVYSTQPNLFSDNSYTQQFKITLKQLDGRWYISESDRCWSAEWRQE